MSQILEGTLFDYANYPTLKCPVIVKKSTEQVLPQPIAKTQEKVAPLQLSIQEPYYSVLAWEPFLAFLAIFLPLFLSVLINADGIIYILVALMGKLQRAQ